MRTWEAPDFYRPIAAPLDHCAELLGVDLATSTRWPATSSPTSAQTAPKVWSLMQLEQQLRPEVFGRRRGGYIDRRRTPTADA
jgi:hypothetical protein